MTEPVMNMPAGGGDRAGEGRRGSLRRPLTGRYVGGVAAGVGRWFGLDPLLVRVAFVVLSVFGGSGFLLYAMAWAIVPEDGSSDGPLRVWLDGRRRPHGVFRVAAYAALAFVGVWVLAFAYQVLITRSYSGFDLPLLGVRWLLGHGLQVGLLVAITLVALSVLSQERADPQAEASNSNAGMPHTAMPSTDLPKTATPSTAMPSTAMSDTAMSDTALIGYEPGSGYEYATGYQQPAAYEQATGSEQPRKAAGDAALVENLRRRRLIVPRHRSRSPLGWLTLGLALAATALLSGLKSAGQVDLSGLQIGAAALLILALGMLVGAFAGWSRWLVVIAVGLSLGLAPVAMTRSASIATYTDGVDAAQFAARGYWEVSRSRGTEVLDLSTLPAVHMPERSQPVDENGNVVKGSKLVTTYNAHGSLNVFLDAGKVIVTLPRNGNWHLSARTSFGTITLPEGVAGRGFNTAVYRNSTDDGAGGCCLTQAVPSDLQENSIYISVSYGDIEVRRAAS